VALWLLAPRATASPAAAAPPSPAPAVSPAGKPSARPSAPPSIAPGLSGLPPARAASLDAAIVSAMGRLGIPGLSAAVVTGRELRWSCGYGLADVENGVAATSSTVYRLASVSKPITATAALQLAEKGRLDLDAPVQRYLPSYPEKPWPITARQLLCHQSGTRNWTEAEFHNTRRFASLTDALGAFKDDPLLFEPGTRTQYSSLGYTLLGAVIEAAAGARFVDVLRADVFDPAGMDSARDDDVFPIVPHRAEGYWRRADGTLLNAPLTDTSNRLPGGGLLGSADDVGRFASALLKGSLLKPETLESALAPQRLRDGKVTGYGLGWLVGRHAHRREAYHTGGQPEVSTVLYLVPDSGVAVAILADLEGVENGLLELARQLALSVSD